jgi:hypothetical protein
MYADAIQHLKDRNRGRTIKTQVGIQDFVDGVARPQLQYSKTTSWITIWFSLRRVYSLLFAL